MKKGSWLGVLLVCEEFLVGVAEGPYYRLSWYVTTSDQRCESCFLCYCACDEKKAKDVVDRIRFREKELCGEVFSGQ